MSLDLYNCPVSQIKCYRDQVFALFPKLKTLDGIDIKGEEVDEGQLCSYTCIIMVVYVCVLMYTTDST